MRPVNLITILLLIALFVASFILSPRLPVKPELSWFVVPTGAALLIALIYTFSAILPEYPELLNIPDKKRYKALLPERKRYVALRARSILTWLAFDILIIAVLVQALIYGEAAGFNTWLMLTPVLIYAVGISPVIAFLNVGKIQEEVRRQHKAQMYETGRSQPA